MSSNTNIGNTPVNQGYVQLIHTGETGGIDGTLRTLYDGDGTASDLQIASNKVKVSTELYIGSDTLQEYIQDTVGAMLVTNASHTNLSAAYDDAGDGAIDLTATGEVTLTGTQTLTNKTLASPTFTGTANGVNLTLSGDLTVNGTTTTLDTTNLKVTDNLIELNQGVSSNANDSGIIIERGSTGDNAIIMWDESADKFTLGTTTATADATGNITITTGTLVASTFEGNLTGNVTGNATGLSSTLGVSSGGTGATTLTSNALLTGNGTSAIQAESNLTFDGSTLAVTGDTEISANLQMGSTSGQGGAKINARVNGNAFNFGHVNQSGYGSTLGCNSSQGYPFLALYSEAGTNANTFRTRGVKGVVLTADTSNNFTINQVATANADNQSLTEVLKINSSGDLELQATKKLYLDGGTHTYIYEASDDVLDFVVGGELQLKLSEAGNGVEIPVDSHPLKIGAGSDLQFNHNGTDSFIENYTGQLNIINNTDDGDIIFKTDNGSGGTTNYLQIDGGAENIYVYKDLRLAATKKLFLDGGGDTYIHESAANVFMLVSGGAERLRTTSTGNIVINEQGNSVDLRVEGNTDPNLFFVDGSADRVGIGIKTPNAKLEVASGNSGGDGALDSPTIRINNTTASSDWDSGDVVGTLEWYASDTSGNAPYVTSFIKSVNPQENGTLPGGYLSFGTCPYNQSGGATEEFRMETDGDFHAKQDVVAFSTTPSDKRLKTNIKDINYGLDTIMSLNPKQYDWKEDNRHDIGFIAQEVEEVIPEIVKDKKHFDKKIKTLDYEKLTAVLIKAVQEQQEQINELKEQLNG